MRSSEVLFPWEQSHKALWKRQEKSSRGADVEMAVPSAAGLPPCTQSSAAHQDPTSLPHPFAEQEREVRRLAQGLSQQ